MNSTIRYNATEIKRQANGLWRNILSTTGIEVPANPRKHGPCPACGGRDRFRFDDKHEEGTFICNQCGAGDGFSLLMNCHNWTFPKALEHVATYLGKDSTLRSVKVIRTHRRQEKPVLDRKKQQRIQQTLHHSVKTGPAMEKYWSHRGLEKAIKQPPSSLRYHPGLPYWQETDKGLWEQTARCPAMLGLVTNLQGKVMTLHRTFLTHNGEKAPFPHPKKLMSPALPGSLRGCSIKLAQPTDTLCLCEGIETALGVWLTTNIPTWACISANLLERVSIPSTIKRLYIMADKDRSKTGEQSAQRLVTRLRKEQPALNVKMYLPPGEIPPDSKGIDWLDIIVQGSQ